MAISPNFAFLGVHDTQLVKIGTLAEKYFQDDPVTCLIKLRQFGELLAQLVAANVGLYTNLDESQLDLLNRLQSQNLLPGDARNLFHQLRKSGNDAVHNSQGSHGLALSHLKYARELGIWFHRTFSNDSSFRPGAFIPPSNPEHETEALKEELARLKKEAEVSRSQAELAAAKALEKTQIRQLAEELLEEAEAELQQKLATIQSITANKSAKLIQQTVSAANEAEQQIDLDENETRRLLIDTKLREAGWEVDSDNLTYTKGTRPQKGKNLAIAEYPVKNGRADYALFIGLEVVGVVEAKRHCKDVSEDIKQAKRYSQNYLIRDEETLCDGYPWGEYKVPFVFSTNGREYLEQLKTKSGIWFCDVRNPCNLSRPLQGWKSPDGLAKLLQQDKDEAHEKLEQEDFNYNLKLRDYQVRAIKKVESVLANNQDKLLLAMATGTGKTKTAIVLVYRLLKATRFKRILFLVDRSALGEQTANAFKDTRIENLQTFSDIFEIKELTDKDVDTETRVNIATVQSFVKKLFYPGDNTEIPTVDDYDCIVVDECHRGYLLDKELSDTELVYRDFNDYISKYRRVLDYFDAVKIGLTATPALHTTQIFGEPVYTYSYREAVIDGWLIDHELPKVIKTRLSEEGIVWQPGEEMEYFDPVTGELDLVHAPDEVKIEVQQFNRRVITEPFNRAVCEELAQYIDPSFPEKTLIFCVTDDHADLVVNLLKEAFKQEYGYVEDDAVVKITGKADKPLQKIRELRNEVLPNVAVTVDLLTTGIDVPAITNLVFLRRVNSRILYEQMLGRATRLCDEIGKEVFRIYDAVRLYEGIAPVSTMKPLAVDPKISFTQLVDELDTVEDEAALPEIIDQLLAKLQRKRRSLSQSSKEQLESIAGMPVEEIGSYIKRKQPQEVAEWFRQRKLIAQILDRKDGGRKPVLISHHEDEVISVETGYGNAEKPEDYLNSFRSFITENMNRIPALVVVTQRPRELTRSQLKELKLELDTAGYPEKHLQIAWRESTNEDIAASIIGFIRQAALGDALISHEARVDRAMNKILASKNWKPPQRKWLERIGKQLKQETIVDKDAFDQGQFKAQGGFERINQTFGGELETVLSEINQELWQEEA
jgi:type I restriction enzyme, R subunit